MIIFDLFIKYLTNDNKASINVIKYDSFLDQVLIGANNGNIYTIHYKEYNATSLTNDLPASNNTCKKFSSQKYGVVENCLYNANGLYYITAQPWAKYLSVFAYGAGGGNGFGATGQFDLSHFPSPAGGSGSSNGTDGYVLIKFSQEPLYY